MKLALPLALLTGFVLGFWFGRGTPPAIEPRSPTAPLAAGSGRPNRSVPGTVPTPAPAATLERTPTRRPAAASSPVETTPGRSEEVAGREPRLHTLGSALRSALGSAFEPRHEAWVLGELLRLEGPEAAAAEFLAACGSLEPIPDPGDDFARVWTPVRLPANGLGSRRRGPEDAASWALTIAEAFGPDRAGSRERFLLDYRSLRVALGAGLYERTSLASLAAPFLDGDPALFFPDLLADAGRQYVVASFLASRYRLAEMPREAEALLEPWFDHPKHGDAALRRALAFRTPEERVALYETRALDPDASAWSASSWLLDLAGEAGDGRAEVVLAQLLARRPELATTLARSLVSREGPLFDLAFEQAEREGRIDDFDTWTDLTLDAFELDGERAMGLANRFATWLLAEPDLPPDEIVSNLESLSDLILSARRAGRSDARLRQALDGLSLFQRPAPTDDPDELAAEFEIEAKAWHRIGETGQVRACLERACSLTGLEDELERYRSLLSELDAGAPLELW